MKAKDYFEDKVQILFMEAVAKGNEHKMLELLKKGAKVDAEGNNGMKPLFWAMAKRNLKGFEFLLENGADPNTVAGDFPDQKRGWSVLELASIAEKCNFLQLLLRYGGNPNFELGYGGRTIIYEAILNNRIENVLLLVDAGTDLNWKDVSGSTPIITAAGINNYDMVYLFISKGADIEIKDRWGKDLAWMISEFGDRGINPKSEQYKWYLKVVEELKSRNLKGSD